jgi:predicted nucleic acid-binding protein
VIVYADASAMVKRYLVERGSRETIAFMARSEMIATSVVSRAEVAAGLAKAVRTRLVTQDRGRGAASKAGLKAWPETLPA